MDAQADLRIRGKGTVVGEELCPALVVSGAERSTPVVERLMQEQFRGSEEAGERSETQGARGI